MPAIKLALSAIPIEIRSDSPLLIDLFVDYFRYYKTEIDPSPSTQNGGSVMIDLKIVDEPSPRDALIPPDSKLFSQTGVIGLWRHNNAAGERFFFDLGSAVFEVDPAAGMIRGWITPDALAYPHILANTYTLFPLLLLLRSRGVYHLHAAAVISPDDKLWLICGPQRAGKTTLTTALGLAGWKPISDDSLLIGFDGEKACLTALKKYFHVGDELFERWPALGGITRRDNYLGRTCAEGLEFFQSRELADQVFDKVDYIILPRIARRVESSIEKISGSEAILKLAEQSMFFQVWRDHLERQWRILGDLARTASSFRLRSGTDYLENPRLAASALELVHKY